MSKLAELAYDIEQMYIEGYSPKTIAALLECDLSVVYDWLEDNSIIDELDEAINEDYDPFETINS
jgi:DNA-directed RNA polymerase specialized sigma24 family protein